MKLLSDERAQSSAELVLLFGGILVIVLVAVVAYRNYLSGLGSAINGTQLNNTTSAISALKNLF